MSKLNRLGAMLLLVAFVGVAWGAATKIPSFVVEDTWGTCFGECSDTGFSCSEGSCASPAICEGVGDQFPFGLDPDAADGMAILNYVPGTDTTIVQVIVSDFTPGPSVLNELIVSLGHDEDLDVGRFTIGAQGNGNFHGEMPGNLTGATVTLCPWGSMRRAFSRTSLSSSTRPDRSSIEP